MRRTLSVLSFGLILLGLELSTKAISLAVARLSAGFTAIASGLEFHVSTLRFAGGVAALALGLGVVGLLLWLTRAESRVTAVGDSCPACAGDTQRLKRRLSHRVLAALMGHRLTRRRCDACGWSGLSVRY